MDYAAKIQHLIDIMKVVKDRNLDLQMSRWYSEVDAFGYNSVPTGIAQKADGIDSYLNTCGTSACFAGWCALDPEIKPIVASAPIHQVIEYVIGDARHAVYLEKGLRDYINGFLQQIACYGDNHTDYYAAEVYGVEKAQDITSEMVIRKLYILKKKCRQVQHMINELERFEE